VAGTVKVEQAVDPSYVERALEELGA